MLQQKIYIDISAILQCRVQLQFNFADVKNGHQILQIEIRCITSLDWNLNSVQKPKRKHFRLRRSFWNRKLIIIGLLYSKITFY
jgi:hypothetical protein